MNLIFSFSLAMVLWLCTFFFKSTTENEPPKVDILKPEKSVSLKGLTQFPYKIQVIDKEDGQTRYDEIFDTEIFLKVKFIKQKNFSNVFLTQEKEKESVFLSMKLNSCFNCHSIQQKSAGPSFREIFSRYGNTKAVEQKLASKIIKGSKGSWGDSQQMPAHPELNINETIGMAKLILNYGADKDLELYNGAEGLIKLKESNSKGIYILIASYLDRGNNGNDRKEGKMISQIECD